MFVFDQFEEVFTLGAGNVGAVEALRTDLADLIENRVPGELARRIEAGEKANSQLDLQRQHCRIILTFREDFLPEVEGWRREIPSLMRNRLRLEPMSAAQAHEAVFTTGGGLVDESVAREIVDFVAAAGRESVRVTAANTDRAIPTIDEQRDPEGKPARDIEPALLSLICRGLNDERRQLEQARIDADLLRTKGHAILSEFYEESVRGRPEWAATIILAGRSEMIVVTPAILLDAVHPSACAGLSKTSSSPSRVTGTPSRAEERRAQQLEAERREREAKQRKQLQVAAVLAGLALLMAAGFAWLWLDARAARQSAQAALEQAEASANEAKRQTEIAERKTDEAEAATKQAQQDKMRAETSETKSRQAEAGARESAAEAHAAQARAESSAQEAERERGHALEQKTIAERKTEEARAAQREATKSAQEAERGRNQAVAAGRQALKEKERAEASELQTALMAVTASKEAERTRAALRHAIVSKLAIESRAILDRARAEPDHHGLLLALAANRLADTPETLEALRHGLVQTPRLVRVDSATASIRAVALSPDGQHIVSGEDKTLRLRDTQTGQPIGAPLTGHGGQVWSVAFSPDGGRIVSGSDDGTLRLWDAQTGQRIGAPLTGHGRRVSSVAFSPDGRYIVSGSGDKTLRLWDPQTGQPIGPPLTGHGRRVSSVAFSPDGRRIASGSYDKTLRLWDAPAAWPGLVCAKLTQNLSHAQWRKYVGDLPYEIQCPGLPVPDD